MPNIKSFGHTASEEMSFEIVDDDGRTTKDDGQTTDTYLSYKLTFGSGELKMIVFLISERRTTIYIL